MGGVLVVGLARSGLGAANLLAAEGREVTVTDIRDEDALGPYVSALDPAVALALGGHAEGIFKSPEMIVLSPGVPKSIDPVARAVRRGVPVISELELGSTYLGGVDIYAVTGTNGKSTTVTVLAAMMEAAGREVMLAGNIGNALCAEVLALKQKGREVSELDCAVIEASSFQLEALDTFRARCSAILNITPDHMDRYASVGEYAHAKAAITANQGPEDFVVLNADDPGCMEIAGSITGSIDAGPQVFYISRERQDLPGVFLLEGSIAWNLGAGKAGAEDKGGIASSAGILMPAQEVRMRGVHNLENAMAASAMALLAQCGPGSVAGTLKDFGGLPHRLEFVRTLGGVGYVNDSKGTNTGAVMKSLMSFNEPVVLIAGGRDKDGDFSVLAPTVAQRVKALVLIGEAADKIASALGGVVRTERAADMQGAVGAARALASPGDVVLLSPGCASFDMFGSFEERGDEFKKIVRAL